MTFGSGGYQGLGVYSGGSPQPPRRRGLKIAMAIALVLLLGAGGVLTAVLLNREDPPQQTTAPATPSRQGWQTVTNAEAGVRYQVPPSWQVLSKYVSTGIGSLDGGGVAQAYPFECEGRTLIRATIASARAEDTSTDPAQAAASAARATAISGYRIGDDLPEMGPPITQPVAGNATATTVIVRSSGKSRCYATQARITAVAVPVSGGRALVVLNVPTDGPHAEHSPNAEQIRGILDSITPLGSAQN